MLEPARCSGVEGLRAAVRAVETSGLDGLFLTGAAELPAPLITAAAVAGMTRDLLIAAEVQVDERRPVELAEEAAVVDRASAGRLIRVLHTDADGGAAFEEAVEVIRTRAGGRQTPPPFGPQIELWGSGVVRELCRARGLVFLPRRVQAEDVFSGRCVFGQDSMVVRGTPEDAKAFGAYLRRIRYRPTGRSGNGG